MADLDVFKQAKTRYQRFTPGQRLVFAFVVAVVAGLGLFLVFQAGEPNYQTLFYDLSPDESAMLSAQLTERNIENKISADGSQIDVPADQVLETRMMLASRGLAKGSVEGFELFNETRVGITEFEQTVKYQRALQGELARTINFLPEVKSSRVHVVMQSESLFEEREKPATASVFLNLRPGNALGRDHVRSIVHILSSSVPGLLPQNVTIVDHYGNLLAGNDRGADENGIGSDRLEYRNKVEARLQDRVKTMLDGVLGPGKSIVRVSVEMDFNKRDLTEEEYLPDNKVTRSERTLTTNSSGDATGGSGTPGVLSNMTENGHAAGGVAGNTSFSKEEKTANYEIGRIVRRTVEQMGRIKKISAAVIVDGVYKEVPVEGKKGETEQKYFPREEGERRELERLVKGAVNFDTARGDVVEVRNIRFEKAPEPESEEEKSNLKAWLPFVVKWLAISISSVFILFIIWKIINVVFQGPPRDGEIMKRLPMTVGEMERQYGEEIGLSFKDQAAREIRQDREKSVRIMRDWMREK